ncbi:MAG: hypothetical protein KatS3mg105_2409 [Gemmatales bacterium]|nr:MAG: hypothetical protein KatS3mg105_2409 [Gemmatales bacterium]
MRQFLCLLALSWFFCPFAGYAGDLLLHPRYRVETSPGSGRFHTLTREAKWEAKKTAIIVCDMWDLHHCLNATRRVREMAPVMNKVLEAARAKGVTIIHAPSSCMESYANHPARKRAIATPRAKKLPKDIGSWCRRIPVEERAFYPIDQTDGGEDDDPQAHAQWVEKLRKLGRNPKAPWKAQIDLLAIRDQDYISDDGEEIWSILEQRGIDNVILVGVHTNMCVLGRPFGLRQMVKNGKNTVLMRDMTDTMYNPKRAPYVSHFTGTDLIVEYIEKYICPTITSTDFVGDKEFRFADDQRPHLVIVMAEGEYGTEETLPLFARQNLGKEFRVSFVFANDKDRNDIPGIDVLNEADVALFSIRRRVLPKKQMETIRQFIAAGKPLVAIRTTSHAFALRNQKPPAGYFDWPEFDHDVIGGNYHNHHREGPKVKISAAPKADKHPILSGVDVDHLTGHGSLYRTSPLSKTATPLLIGSIPNQKPEPIAWINRRQDGGLVFYTSLGHRGDFEDANFVRLLTNAIRWSVRAASRQTP